MASVKHKFVSVIADDPASVLAGEVVPSNWNDEHSVSLAAADISGLGFVTSGSASAMIAAALVAGDYVSSNTVSAMIAAAGTSGLSSGSASSMIAAQIAAGDYVSSNTASAMIATALGPYITSASASAAFVTSASLATTLGGYLTSASASALYLTSASAALSTYLTSASASALYLTSASANLSAYLTSASASALYLTSASAAAVYVSSGSVSAMIAAQLVAGDYVSSNTVSAMIAAAGGGVSMTLSVSIMSVLETLSVSGAANFKLSINVSATASVGALQVAGTTSLSGAVVAMTTLDTFGILTAQSGLVAATTFTASGVAGFLGTLRVSATLSAGNIATAGTLQVAGISTLSGAVVVSTTLAVSATASVGALHVTGAAVHDGTTTLSGAVVAHTTMTVSGVAGFLGSVRVSATLSASVVIAFNAVQVPMTGGLGYNNWSMAVAPTTDNFPQFRAEHQATAAFAQFIYFRARGGGASVQDGDPIGDFDARARRSAGDDYGVAVGMRFQTDGLAIGGGEYAGGKLIVNTRGSGTSQFTYGLSPFIVNNLGTVSFNNTVAVAGTTTLSGAVVALTTMSVSGALVAKTSLRVEGNSTLSATAVFSSVIQGKGNGGINQLQWVPGTTFPTLILEQWATADFAVYYAARARAGGASVVDGDTITSFGGRARNSAGTDYGVAAELRIDTDGLAIAGGEYAGGKLSIFTRGASSAQFTYGLTPFSVNNLGTVSFNNTVAVAGTTTLSGAVACLTTLAVSATISVGGAPIYKPLTRLISTSITNATSVITTLPTGFLAAEFAINYRVSAASGVTVLNAAVSTDGAATGIFLAMNLQRALASTTFTAATAVNCKFTVNGLAAQNGAVGITCLELNHNGTMLQPLRMDMTATANTGAVVNWVRFFATQGGTTVTLSSGWITVYGVPT